MVYVQSVDRNRCLSSSQRHRVALRAQFKPEKQEWCLVTGSIHVDRSANGGADLLQLPFEVKFRKFQVAANKPAAGAS